MLTKTKREIIATMLKAGRPDLANAATKILAAPAQWGFDLTGFNSPQEWKKILAALGIKPKATKVPMKQLPGLESRFPVNEFHWKGAGILIVTGNDPITGEYMNARNRESEPGYASYIGIEGQPDKVKQAVELIKQYGSWKDESPGRRDFI